MARRVCYKGNRGLLAIILLAVFQVFPDTSSSQSYGHGYSFNHAAADSLMWADDFNDGDASNWLVVEGNWTVVNNSYMGSHTADGRTMAGDISWTNYRYDGVFMFDTENPYEATILFRIQDAGVGANIGHYYEVANYAGLDQVTLWHISNGAVDLLTVPYTFETGVWYQFVLEVWGTQVRYFINEILVLEYDQLTHYSQGRIGVKSFISAAWFDDLQVTSIDEPTGISGGSAYSSPEVVSLTNWPNPFRNTTTVSFELGSPGRVRLYVYDVTGRRIRTLLSSPVDAGPFSMTWDGRDLAGRMAASGVYFCRLESEQGLFTRKMIKVR